MEIERKFLLNSLPEDFDSYPHREMEQGYLITDGCTLRIRKADDDCYLTLKQKPGSHEGSVIVNEEFETEIPEESYEALKQLVIEVDVFHGNLEGLVFAEIEYRDGDDALTLPLPVWFDRDVSGDRRFRNTKLSEMTKRDAQRLLNEIAERSALVL